MLRANYLQENGRMNSQVKTSIQPRLLFKVLTRHLQCLVVEDEVFKMKTLQNQFQKILMTFHKLSKTI